MLTLTLSNLVISILIVHMLTLLYFVWFDSLRPTNNLSVIKGQVFLGWTSSKLGLMCLAQGHKAVTPVRLAPAAPRSRVKHFTTEPLRAQLYHICVYVCCKILSYIMEENKESSSSPSSSAYHTCELYISWSR